MIIVMAVFVFMELTRSYAVQSFARALAQKNIGIIPVV